MKDRLFTKKEVIDRLKMSLSKLNQDMALGRIGYIKLGGNNSKVLFRYSDISNYIDYYHKEVK